MTRRLRAFAALSCGALAACARSTEPPAPAATATAAAATSSATATTAATPPEAIRSISAPIVVPLMALSSAAEWFPYAEGSSLSIAVERALYELPGAPHFFVRVRVTNHGTRDAGVDLRAFHHVFYPNQWSASDLDHRLDIDEMRAPFPPLDDAAKAQLSADYRAGKLTPVSVGAPLDYYVEFNGSARADVDTQSRGRRTKYVVVTMDGALLVSDGVMSGQIMSPAADYDRDVGVPAPVGWREVPAGARVVADVH